MGCDFCAYLPAFGAREKCSIFQLIAISVLSETANSKNSSRKGAKKTKEFSSLRLCASA